LLSVVPKRNECNLPWAIFYDVLWRGNNRSHWRNLSNLVISCLQWFSNVSSQPQYLKFGIQWPVFFVPISVLRRHIKHERLLHNVKVQCHELAVSTDVW
jgi:hypothetical protein